MVNLVRSIQTARHQRQGGRFMRSVAIAIIALALCSCGPSKFQGNSYINKSDPTKSATGYMSLCKKLRAGCRDSFSEKCATVLEMCMWEYGFTYTGPDAYVDKPLVPNNNMGWK
jgi:hypothetical protein